MAGISGIGERKLEQFGAAFLEIIQAHPRHELLDNNLSDTVNETLSLYAKGEDIESIARIRGLTTNTIYSHLAGAISIGLLDAAEILPLSEVEYREIGNALELYAHEASMPLKPVHEALEGAYDYGILKCVQAGMGLADP
jgi:ATP-dependent DNA helicase RecQ